LRPFKTYFPTSTWTSPKASGCPTSTAPPATWPARPSPPPSSNHDYHGGFPPNGQLDLALATFLLKILDQRFLVRDRPGRASPRKTKKTGDFPRRADREPNVPHVTRRIELRCLEHLRSP